jgi:protein phosphatase-4 regulatory subunit 3
MFSIFFAPNRDRIKEIQMRYSRNHRGHRLGGPGSSHSFEGEFDDLFCKSDDDEDDTYPSNTISTNSRLPPATPKHIDDILPILAELFMVSKTRMATLLIRDHYVEALCELFKMVEDLGNMNDLHKTFEIFKMLVMLNHPRIIDKLFHPDNVFQVMGALEYDPELAKRPQHRKFLEEEVVFNQVVTLPPQLIEQIHRSFRIQYMKDVVLPRILDETTFAFLNSVIMFANTKIVGLIRNDENILTELCVLIGLIALSNLIYSSY